MARKTTEERFWEKVDKQGPDDCWEWLGIKDETNQGRFYELGKKRIYSHRFSWKHHNGSIPDGSQVLHKCGNSLCVNPNHLFIGTLDNRFWKKVNKDCPSGCWLWVGHLNNRGYGRFREDENVFTYAHRHAWRLHNGPIPENKEVCHHCDVRNCVNPEHLFLGTHQDNMDDMVQKERQGSLIGEKHPKAKLRECDVLYIRKLWLWTEDKPRGRKGLVRKLADLFGVSTTQIYGVINRKYWNHLKEVI